MKQSNKVAMILFMILVLVLSAGCNLTGYSQNNSKARGLEGKELQERDVVSSQGDEKAGSVIGSIASEGPNEELANVIKMYLDLDEEAYKATRYYYNYVHLNEDKTEDVFVLLIGMYTSGTGGDTGLIMGKENGRWRVMQQLTLVNQPIIISDKVVNGWRQIITYRSGGGAESTYVVLSNEDGRYQTVNEGKAIPNLDGIRGLQIINNNIAKEIEEGKNQFLE